MYEVYCMGRIYFDDGSIHYDNLPIKWNLIIDMPTKCLCNISPILGISLSYNLKNTIYTASACLFLQ